MSACHVLKSLFSRSNDTNMTRKDGGFPLGRWALSCLMAVTAFRAADAQMQIVGESTAVGSAQVAGRVFGEIQDLALDRDGHIIVLDGEFNQLHLFSERGEYLSS